MKRFFQSRGFKSISVIVCVLLVVSILFGTIGKKLSPQSNFLGAILVPFQKLGNTVSGGVDGLFTAVGRLDLLEEENNQLREEIRVYREQLVEYDDYKRENEFYKQFLEIKEQNNDYTFQPATITARDNSDASGSFTIDAGSNDGVALHDPVITKDGLVGYVSQLGVAMSTVTTVLDPQLHVGALVSRTKEAGVVKGATELLERGCCSLSYLSGTSAVTNGDYVITSGSGGIFPKGIIIGVVEEVKKEQASTSLYGVVKPVVNFDTLTQVMVITQFQGQGGIADEK